MVIIWCVVRTTRLMQRNFPTQLPEHLASHYRLVFTDVVLIKHNFTFFGVSWGLMGVCPSDGPIVDSSERFELRVLP